MNTSRQHLSPHFHCWGVPCCRREREAICSPISQSITDYDEHMFFIRKAFEKLASPFRRLFCLEFPKEEVEELQAFDRNAWRQEVVGHKELFIELHDRLPPETIYEREL